MTVPKPCPCQHPTPWRKDVWKSECVEGDGMDGIFSPGKKGRSFFFEKKNISYTNEVVEVDVERIECLRINDE